MATLLALRRASVPNAIPPPSPSAAEGSGTGSGIEDSSWTIHEAAEHDTEHGDAQPMRTGGSLQLDNVPDATVSPSVTPGFELEGFAFPETINATAAAQIVAASKSEAASFGLGLLESSDELQTPRAVLERRSSAGYFPPSPKR